MRAYLERRGLADFGGQFFFSRLPNDRGAAELFEQLAHGDCANTGDFIQFRG